MRKQILFALVILPFSLAYSQQDDSIMIRKIADEILINSKAYENLKYLTKKIGARLAGSRGMVLAEQWGLQALQKNGADKTWLQQCMVPHWVRGAKEELRIVNTTYKNKKLSVAALGNSIGTGSGGITAPLIEIQSFEDLEVKKAAIKGKIVFYNYKFNSTLIRTFEAYGDAGKYRFNGPVKASEYGAVGVVLRSMSHSVDNYPHTGSTASGKDVHTIPSLAIGLQDADWLHEVLKRESITVTLKSYAHFLPDTIGHNVIGELTGREFPDEIITVGGHLDSWDLGEGAHDDGAGIVQTIEMLRAFKSLGYTPRHTIRFVLFANEENGMRGGRKYAEEAKLKNEKHIFALESDAGGFTPRAFSISTTAKELATAQSWIPLLKPYGVYEIFAGGSGADIGPLAQAYKIPAAGLIPDSQRYFDYHHAGNDVLENVNKRELELGAINMAALIYLVDKYGF